jgi:hypothetical protein
MANALCASLCPDPHFPTHHSTPDTSQRADTHTHAHLMTLNTHQKLFYFFATRVRAGGAVQRITFLIRFSHSLICYWSGWRGASPRHTTRCASFHHSNLIKLSFKFNEKTRSSHQLMDPCIHIWRGKGSLCRRNLHKSTRLLAASQWVTQPNSLISARPCTARSHPPFNNYTPAPAIWPR